MRYEPWTAQDVANQFEEAIYTLKRMPKAVNLGCRSNWPPMVMTMLEQLQQDKKPMRLGPPLPEAITRMEQTLTWVSWIENEDERKLIWLRATRTPWKMICARFGVSKTTAWNCWCDILEEIATHLNKNGGTKVRMTFQR